MRRRWLAVGIAVVPVALLGGVLAAACDTVECGTGTREENGVCVAAAETPCPCALNTVPEITDAGCGCVPVHPCGAGTRWDYVSGECVLDGAPGVPAARTAAGACWTSVGMLRPVNTTVIGLPGPPGCTMDPVAVETLMATTTGDDGRLMLVGGQGIPVPAGDGGAVAYGLIDHFLLDGQPAGVPLVVDAERGFATDPGGRLFEWRKTFLPNQPPLRLRDVNVTGTLDADDRPSSAGTKGRLVGCFTQASAAAIYIDVLSQTFLQLIEANGVALDCDATGGGSIDGYQLELRWDAAQPVDVVY